jgi:hypothetical protein
MGTADSLHASRLFASIDAVNKSDNAGPLRGRQSASSSFFKLEDHQPKLYGFVTYLETATETKGLATERENWAGFYVRLL